MIADDAGKTVSAIIQDDKLRIIPGDSSDCTVELLSSKSNTEL